MKSVAARVLAMSGAATIALSAPASAAVQAQSASYSPWAALSAFAGQSSSQALCGAAATTAAQTGTPGCVLPATDAPVAPVGNEPVAVVPEAVGGTGLGVLPLIAGLAVLAGAIALIASSGDDDDITVTPVSPV